MSGDEKKMFDSFWSSNVVEEEEEEYREEAEGSEESRRHLNPLPSGR